MDHNPLLRQGLSLLIQLQPDMELVATANQADGAVQLFSELQPDIILMDLDLPEGGGVKAIQQTFVTSGKSPMRSPAPVCTDKSRLMNGSRLRLKANVVIHDVTTFSDQIGEHPMIFPLLDVLNLRSSQLGAS